MERPAPRVRAWYALLPSAILLAPVLSFLVGNNYSLVRPEVLLWVLGAVAAGAAAGAVVLRSPGWLRAVLLASCLTLFVEVQFAPLGPGTLALAFAAFAFVVWLLRENAFPILSAGFAALLLSILVVPARAPLQAFSGVAVGTRPVREELPPVIVLILDEHIGLEGIPLEIDGGAEVRKAVSDLYESHGFRLYPRAYSQYGNTTDSLSNLLNHAVRRTHNEWIQGADDHFSLRESLFLRRAASSGYAIRIYQSDYLDLCNTEGVRLESCLTYKAASTGSIQGQDVTWSDKAAVIGSTLLAKSALLDAVNRLKVLLRRLGVPVRQPGDEPLINVGPIESMAVLDRFEADIKGGARGRLFLAHLLIPHFSYVYDADCRLKPLDQVPLRQRLKSLTSSTVSSLTGPEEVRRDRYGRYFSQVQCLTRRLDSFFGALEAAGALEDAVVIVLGDHGPRITSHNLNETDLGSFRPVDLVDSHSALFAARGPGIEPGSEPEPRTLVRAFAEVLGTHAPPPETESLLMVRKGQTELIPVPMPPF